jgi:tRNA dimethylallyltransferase
MKGIGYREWQSYFQGECTREDVKEAIQKNSRHFAKRQYTWLNHQMPVHWFDITDSEDTDRILKEIRTWYGQHCI